jgi:DNA-binding MarR family transcriptional regulator
MEKKGLVRKVKDLEKKNQVRVAMTEKGQQACEQASKRESIHRIMSSLNDSECEHLVVCLQSLLDKALDEAGITSKPPFP